VPVRAQPAGSEVTANPVPMRGPGDLGPIGRRTHPPTKPHPTPPPPKHTPHHPQNHPTPPTPTHPHPTPASLDPRRWMGTNHWSGGARSASRLRFILASSRRGVRWRPEQRGPSQSLIVAKSIAGHARAVDDFSVGFDGPSLPRRATRSTPTTAGRRRRFSQSSGRWMPATASLRQLIRSPGHDASPAEPLSWFGIRVSVAGIVVAAGAGRNVNRRRAKPFFALLGRA